MTQFQIIRDSAKEERGADGERTALAQKILELDTSSINRDIRFFYPYEVQIVDEEEHQNNTDGEASHEDYKKQQVQTARDRLFYPLLKHRGLIS